MAYGPFATLTLWLAPFGRSMAYGKRPDAISAIKRTRWADRRRQTEVHYESQWRVGMASACGDEQRGNRRVPLRPLGRAPGDHGQRRVPAHRPALVLLGRGVRVLRPDDKPTVVQEPAARPALLGGQRHG